VTADAKTRTYGSANPELTGTLSGVENVDNISAIYSTTATPDSSVGAYPINITLNDPDYKLTNYTVVTTPATLTVTAATLTVTANNQSRFYGGSNPV